MATRTLPIPLSKGTYKNVYDEELSDFDARLIDCYVDDLGYTRKRPGLNLLKDVGSYLGVTTYPINGLYWWKNKTVALAVSYGKTLKIAYTSGYTTITDLTSTNLAINSTPTFATDGTYAFIVKGGQILYTDGTASTAAIADADAPTTVTHVDWMDGYLLACGDGTNKFYWSDVNSSLSWNALNYASAAGNADPILALKVFQRQILLFGQNTLEVWENDGVNPFSRIAGGFHDVGISAPHSIIVSDQAIYWLSDTRRIMRFQNAQLSAASTPYDKDISGYTTVSDCRGFRCVIDGKTFLIFTFPSAEKTLVYSEVENKWHEWGYWDVGTATRGRWLGNCLVWSPDWSLHIVGGRSGGLLYKMAPDYYNDNGNPIRLEKRTGFIDYGVKKAKRSEEIRFRAKRGIGGISRDPKLMFRWNTDNKGWNSFKDLSLGQEGESEIVMSLKRTGMFQARQYEIVVTDDVPVAFGDGEEDITILR